ncbi:MAG: hypothetical protein H3Z50_05515 [archaeon]|nr:hypothetical protein [archaeon]MCP8305939.1 hypothetical protein [archaeon]
MNLISRIITFDEEGKIHFKDVPETPDSHYIGEVIKEAKSLIELARLRSKMSMEQFL